MGAYAYAYTNRCTGLAASAFTWSAGMLNDATRARLNDNRMDSRYVAGNPATSVSVVIDLGSALAVDGWAVLNSNAAVQKTCTLTIEAADDAAITVNAVTAKSATTLNVTAPRNKDHVLQFGVVTKRYWRLTWATTGSWTNFAIGELFAYYTTLSVGTTRLSRKRIYGGGEREQIITSALDFGNGNTRSYFVAGPVRSKRLPFSDLTEAEREELMQMWRRVKAGATPMLWIESYEAVSAAAANAEQEVVYGRCMLPDFAWSEPDFNLFTPDSEIIITSLGREVGA